MGGCVCNAWPWTETLPRVWGATYVRINEARLPLGNYHHIPVYCSRDVYSRSIILGEENIAHLQPPLLWELWLY